MQRWNCGVAVERAAIVSLLFSDWIVIRGRWSSASWRQVTLVCNHFESLLNICNSFDLWPFPNTFLPHLLFVLMDVTGDAAQPQLLTGWYKGNWLENNDGESKNPKDTWRELLRKDLFFLFSFFFHRCVSRTWLSIQFKWCCSWILNPRRRRWVMRQRCSYRVVSAEPLTQFPSSWRAFPDFSTSHSLGLGGFDDAEYCDF